MDLHGGSCPEPDREALGRWAGGVRGKGSDGWGKASRRHRTDQKEVVPDMYGRQVLDKSAGSVRGAP